ncbi:MAG TPA: non-canonical purine NTP pyrophosphatase, partial [Anaerolineales bacterium]
MTKNTRVLLATTNRGKLHEMSTILGEPGIRLVTTSDVGIDLAVDETGSTYVDNAVLKARAYAAASGLITLGDDSGLEVDALDGAPGVRAARIAGPGATDADRYNLLLSKLEGVPADRRTARFRCAVALAAPAGQLATAEGACEGRIAFRPAGKNGFGYDPVFYLD